MGADTGFVNVSYIQSIPGILQIVKFVLSVIVLICVGAGYPTLVEGGGWTLFVAIIALIVIVIFYVLHVTNLNERIGGKFPGVELVSYAVMTFLFIIALIVEAVIASRDYQYERTGELYNTSAEIAASIFLALVILAHIANIIVHVTGWRVNSSSTTTTNTTTTTTDKF